MPGQLTSIPNQPTLPVGHERSAGSAADDPRCLPSACTTQHPGKPPYPTVGAGPRCLPWSCTTEAGVGKRGQAARGPFWGWGLPLQARLLDPGPDPYSPSSLDITL